MIVDDILKVLYAPHKAFKKIVHEPKYLGPFVLLIIFVIAQVGSAYVVASKSYVEQTFPAAEMGDAWTQNAALWTASPDVAVSNNTVDYINGTYYGQVSIQFSASNVSNVWMENNWGALNGSVNCGADGFKNVSFRVKTITPDADPANVKLYLYSLGDSYFERDVTSVFTGTAFNVWNNVTVQVGSESGWTSSGVGANWENITGIKMEFTWSSSQNVDLRVVGLFFRGVFKGPLEVYGMSYLASSALNAVTPYLFQWLLLTGLIYVIVKGLKGNVVWKPLMVAVGFALVVMSIQAVIMAVVYTTLPEIPYPLEVLMGVSGEFAVAYQLIIDAIAGVSQIGGIVQVVFYVWIVALGAFVTREVTAAAVVEGAPAPVQFGWMKSLLTSVASFLLTLVILGFVLGV